MTNGQQPECVIPKTNKHMTCIKLFNHKKAWCRDLKLITLLNYDFKKKHLKWSKLDAFMDNIDQSLNEKQLLDPLPI